MTTYQVTGEVPQAAKDRKPYPNGESGRKVVTTTNSQFVAEMLAEVFDKVFINVRVEPTVES